MKVKKQTKPKKGVRFLCFCSEVFFVSALVYLGTSLFLRTYNNGIASRISIMNEEITAVEKDNDTAKADVRILSSRSGVTTAADGHPVLLEDGD